MSETRLYIRDSRPTVVVSASGPQGPTGAGIKVLGELAGTGNLPALPNPTLNAGDAYIIAGSLWVYASSGVFVNTGFVEGAPGPQGVQGPQGNTGPQGPIGSSGPTGATGAVGPKGDKGEQGTSIAIKGTLGSPTELPALPQTPQDAYIITGDLYVWTNGNWTNVGAFRGPQGVAGPAGATGPQGSKGDTGAVGPTGATGPAGAKGDTGAQGIQGLQGPKGDTGSQGPAGVTGPKGDTGSQGIQGVKGDTGSVGPQGPIGDTGAKGDQGIQGIAGPKGDQGIQGVKGDTGTAGTAGKNINNAVFTAKDALSTFTGVSRFYVAQAGSIVLSKASLGTSGSTATTVVVKKNGTTAHTLTIASGTNVQTVNTTVAVVANDYITVDVTGAGTGAKDLTVLVRVEE